jgi:hypothetical protein
MRIENQKISAVKIKDTNNKNKISNPKSENSF